MAVKGVLFVLIGTFLVVRSLTPIKWSCISSGFEDFQSLMTFRGMEDTGLLWMYAFNNPPRPKKLTRNEKLLNTRSLIVILLIIGGIESHPGEFL